MIPSTDSLLAGRGRMVLAVASGLLLSAAFPKPGLWLLAWVALVPLLVALRGVGAGEAFRLGMLAGLAHYLSLLYWVVITMRTYGYLPWWQCVSLLVLLAAYLALYPGLFALSVVRLCRTPLRLLFLAPVFWVALEYARGFLLTGFPWGLVGYSQFNQLHIIQISDMFGVYGISFVVVLTNAAIYGLLLFAGGKTWGRGGVDRRRAIGIVAAAVLALGATLGYGSWRMAGVDRLAATAPVARVALVQGNIEQATKWDPAFQIATTRKYVEMTRAAAQERPDLVVWPETATPFYFGSSAELTGLVLGGIRQAGVHLLTGSPSVDRGGERYEYYNSAYLLTPEGRMAGRYDKVHLVPFGEYVPLKNLLSFAGKMVAQVGDFSAGQTGRTLSAGADQPDIGVLICFEVIFADLARAMAKNGAGILTNLTNDAWFDKSAAAYQHFAMAVLRAVENRRSLVRCANTGISGFIDPAGRVLERTELFEDAVAIQALPRMTMTTAYTRWGDILPLACLIAWLGLAAWRHLPSITERLAARIAGRRR